MDADMVSGLPIFLAGAAVFAVAVGATIGGLRSSARQREAQLAEQRQASLVRRRQAHLASTLAPHRSCNRLDLPVGPGAQAVDVVQQLRIGSPSGRSRLVTEKTP